MTCTADGFGLNSVRKSKRISLETNPGFARNRDLHNVFFQMCGSKQKFPHLKLDKLSTSCDQRHAETASKTKCDLNIAVSKDAVRENTPFSIKARENAAVLPCGQIIVSNKFKHEPAYKESSCVVICPDATASSSRCPATCALQLPAEIHHPMSLRKSQELGSLMLMQSGNFNGRQKRSRTDGDDGATDRKRKKSADNNNQPESMDVGCQKLPAPFSDYTNPLEVTQHPNTNFREGTSQEFSPFLLADPDLRTSNIWFSAAKKCRNRKRIERREDIMECIDLDIQIKTQDIGVFHGMMQKLLINCICSQKKRYSIYIPLWKNNTIRIHGTSCGRYRTDNPNRSFSSTTGRSCQFARCRFQNETQHPTHSDASDQSLNQLQNADTVRNGRSQGKVRSQIQAMRRRWLGLPRQFQHRLDVSRRFILVLDKYLRVMFVSENVSRHLGYQQDDMLGRSIGQFVHPKQISEISRLARGRHLQTDDTHGGPLWKTGKVLTVAMKFCLHTARDDLPETGYKPVLWTVNIRLKKRGVNVRAQDMVILCHPLHDCTIPDLQMGGDMLINPCNLSFNFYVGNFGCKLTERTLLHKSKSWNGIKCLGLDTESCLLSENHHGSNNLKRIGHNYPRGTASDFNLKQLLQSCPLNLHFCSSCKSKCWTKLVEMSENNYGIVVNPNAKMALQSFRCLCENKTKTRLFNNILNCACSVSHGVGNICPFSATCTNSSIMARSGTLQDVKMQVGIKVFDNSCERSLSLHLEPTQRCFSPIKLQSQQATSVNCLNKASSFSDNISPYLLMKTSVDHTNIPIDEFASDEEDISDDSESTSQDVTDVEFSSPSAESEPESPAAESESESPLEKSQQQSFCFDRTQNPALILPASKQPDQPLLTSHHLPLNLEKGSTFQHFSHQCKSDAKENFSLIGHVTSDNNSEKGSSSLPSILKMKNISPVPVRENINEKVFLQTCPTVCSVNSTPSTSHTGRKRKNTLLHSFLLDLANIPAYESSTLCTSKSPPTCTSPSKSSSVHHQLSLASSTSCSTAFSNWSSVGNQISFVSTPTSDDDNQVNDSHLHGKVTSNSKSTSLITESATEQTEYVNAAHRVSSKMTYQKYDPFLSQASFSDFNSFPNSDIFDDLASVTCSVTSPLSSRTEPGTDQDAESHLKDQFSSSNLHNFLDQASESTSFTSESLSDLDSLLNTIPVNNSTNAQTSLLPGWLESDTSQSSDSISLSNYFFNKETTSRPSLLRKLLDKEGSGFQKSESDTGWILDQFPEKSSDLKKRKMNCGSTKLKYSVCKQANCNKNTIRSIEIPKVRLNLRQIMQVNKHKPQYQKQTKELPLPSSIKSAGTSPTNTLLQQDAVANGSASRENLLEKEMRKSTELDSSDLSTDYELPDDLIDMAVECCAPLEMDQTEALISDLNDSCSWEDNLYSLLESSGQENSGNDSGCESSQQKSEMSVTSKHPPTSCELFSGFFHSKYSFSKPSLSYSTTADSGFLPHRKSHTDTPKSSSSQTSLPSQQKVASHHINKISVCSANVPSVSTPNSTNTTAKMSLLRAAITSDVDKLIEQIPLINSRKPPCNLHRTSEEKDDDPDILITKVTGLKENHGQPSDHKLRHKVSKCIPAHTARPSENIPLCKALQSSKTTTNASGKVMSPLSAQTFSTNVPAATCDKWRLVQNGSSCEHCGNTPKTPPIINPLVIKISIGSSSTSKVFCANRGSQNSFSQHLKSDSQKKVCEKSSYPRFSPTQKFPSTDFSSTQPVSVMIMRKENHRSRRSKNIAIQTDNEPGEVYPEFEHSPSDTIMYPSTILTFPSEVSTPQYMSPLSTTLMSHSSSSEIDTFLPSHPSIDDSSSSADDDYRAISSTPFLWKLLTGELSKDHYQRLDQQMIEKERKNIPCNERKASV